MTQIKTAPINDSQRLAIGIYSHVLVNRRADVKAVLGAAGIAPGATVYETHAQVQKALQAGNKQVTAGMQNIVASEIAKVPQTGNSKYSNFWNVLIGMLGSSGGNTNTGGATSNSSGGGGGGIISDAVNAPFNMFKTILSFGDKTESNTAMLQQIASMQAAKQQAQTRTVLIVCFTVLIATVVGIYVIRKKTK